MAIHTRVLDSRQLYINGTNIKKDRLFSDSTQVMVINPSVFGPFATISAATAEPNKQVFTSLSLANASQFLDSAWTAGGWNIDILPNQLEKFAKTNLQAMYAVPNADLVISKVSNGGSVYYIAMVYPGSLNASETILENQNNVVLSCGLATSTPNGGGPHAGLNKFSYVSMVPSIPFVDIGVTMGIDASNRIYCWGAQTNTGANGDGTNSTSVSPALVVGNIPFASLPVNLLSNNNQTRGALSTSGIAWMWGSNASGAVGDNTATNRSSPVQVVGNHSFNKLYLANQTIFGIKADGSLWGWGSGTSGQLGNNNIINVSSPVQVIGGHVFSSVLMPSVQTFGLKADGSAWSWGNNLSGVLGDNTTTNRSSPVAVVGGHQFTKLVAPSATNNAFGLKANGQVWGWGNNANGQIGDNTIINRSSPVLVVGNHSFIDITVGDNTVTVTGLKADGSAWSWGVGSGGQLGDNTATVSVSSPVLVAGNHSFVSLLPNQGGAMKADGSVWVWGVNTNGKLGDSTTTARSSPVQILRGYAVSKIFPSVSTSSTTAIAKPQTKLE